MNKVKIVYRLDVRLPGALEDTLHKIESDQPFPAFSKGDLFRNDGGTHGMVVGEVARVLHFTYIINDAYTHETWVYLKSTNAFESSDKMRKSVYG